VLAVAAVALVLAALSARPAAQTAGVWASSPTLCGHGASPSVLRGRAPSRTRRQAETSLSRLMQKKEAIERAKAEKREGIRRQKQQAEEEKAEAVVLPPSPVLYECSSTSKRLYRQTMTPGHLVQRKWVQKGKDQGYVSVPFASAVKSVLPDPNTNVCLIGRRESSDLVARGWQKVLDDSLPTFDISGVAEAPSDLDPMEPAWETPLDEPLPSDDELRALARVPGMLEHMQKRFRRDAEELAYRSSKYRETPEAKVFRAVVGGLPAELLGEEFRELVRSTIRETLQVLWTLHMSTNATKMRWRLACTDGEPDPEGGDEPTQLRAYFILAGEGLDFVPSQFVEKDKLSATNLLDTEQLRRMSSEDWASSVAAPGSNTSEVLKRVPAGWTTYLKGNSWPGMQGKGATYRLKQTGKRLFIQADFLEGPKPTSNEQEQNTGTKGSEEEQGSREVPKTLLWLGPIAGVVTGLFELARKSPPFVFGQQRRREIDEVLRALQRAPARNLDAEMSISRFEERLWMDFADADEAPVVLVVGGQSQTGKVISRKLVTSGYHVVLLQPQAGGKGGARVERLLPQGTVLAKAQVDPISKGARGEEVSFDNIPDALYNAVAGIDKLVICNCDQETNPSKRLTTQFLTDVLACWQLYRFDFADKQRAYSTKVRLFNFDRETDFELWDLERQRPSDLCYGRQRCGWTRNSYGEALFIGQFFDPIGQAQLKSPRLRLNFKRFSGLVVSVYNQAVSNKYSWFLRMSDFEETRLQYEFDFECEASTSNTVRMPFNAFRPVRADGVPLPEGEVGYEPLRREDVVQMGVTVRTEGKVRPYGIDGRLNYFSLAIFSIKVFRRQGEPQVIYLGRQQDLPSFGAEEGAEEGEEEEEEEEMIFSGDDLDETFLDLQKAEEEAEAEIAELVRDQPLPEPKAGEDDDEMEFFEGRPKSPAQAVVQSGLAYTAVHVNGLNDHPGGRYAVSVHQASVHDAPLSNSFSKIGTIARGDVAELAVSALVEPKCVNAEIAAGESPRGQTVGQKPAGLNPTFEIRSTLQEDVKAYMKQLTPNT